MRVSGGWFAPDHLYRDDCRLAAVQAGWLWQPGAPRSGELLAGFLRFDDLDALPAELFRTNRFVGNRLASDYRLLDAQAALRLPLGPTGLALRADLVRNLGADTDRDAIRAIVVAGGAERAGAVEVAYSFQQIERDACPGRHERRRWWFHSRSRGHMYAWPRSVVAGVGASPGFSERRDDLTRAPRG